MPDIVMLMTQITSACQQMCQFHEANLRPNISNNHGFLFLTDSDTFDLIHSNYKVSNMTGIN